MGILPTGGLEQYTPARWVQLATFGSLGLILAEFHEKVLKGWVGNRDKMMWKRGCNKSMRMLRREQSIVQFAPQRNERRQKRTVILL
jgi:hypothetical protein